MNIRGWTEIFTTLVCAIAVGWLMGGYLSRVWRGEPTWLDRLLSPVESAFYRLAGVDSERPQRWQAYAASLITFNAVGFLLLFAMLLLQGVLPLNPQHAPGLPADLAFSTAVGFVTNTDWLPANGEAATSELSQMAGFLTQNFLSAGTALAVAAAFTRAFGANRSATIGNFWSDLTRVTLYFLLPVSIALSLVLVAVGVPQTLTARVLAHGVEGGRQLLASGPLASQVAIAEVGSNGAGFFDAGSAHPFINPSPLTNFIEAVVLYAAGLACIFAFGRSLYARSQAWTLVIAVAIVIGGVASITYVSETSPTPALARAHAQPGVNMEGKETRFGAPGSAAFIAMSNGARNGSTNADMESFTPASSGAAMFVMQMGGMLPGSVGAGLISVLLFCVLAVLIGGMMVGRTPEFLGKRVDYQEVRLVVASILILNVSILGFSALAALTPAADGASKGPHGLMEIVYTYTSGVANTGSAFAGLDTEGAFWTITLGLAMALGRYAVLLPALAIAGRLAAKPKSRPTDGTFPTDGPLFVGLLLGVLVIVSGLQYFPVMALGPIAEQLEIKAAQPTAATPVAAHRVAQRE